MWPLAGQDIARGGKLVSGANIHSNKRRRCLSERWLKSPIDLERNC